MEVLDDTKEKSAAMSSLVCLYLKHSKRLIPLDFGTHLIGRVPEKCVCCLDSNPNVSKIHASITFYRTRRVTIQDLGSGNGTFINGLRLQPMREYPVKNGDIIHLANEEVICYTEVSVQHLSRDITH